MKNKNKNLNKFTPKSITDFIFDGETLSFPEEFLPPPKFDIELNSSNVIENVYFGDHDIKNSTYKKKSNPISNNNLAAILAENHTFIKFEEMLYVWDDDLCHYIHFYSEYADQFIRRNTPVNFKNKITLNTNKEIIQWIKAEFSEDIERSIQITFSDELLLFKNGILNLRTSELITPSSKYFFTSAINGSYKKIKFDYNTHFERFMEDITAGNELLYARLQELFGAVISNTRSIKYIPYLVGVKDSGKTLTLKLLESLLGEKYCTNLSFDQLNKSEYLAELIGKRLNTCAETSELTLNRLDILKKLSGNDPLMARPLYDSPVKFVNKALLIFAGNHLPTIRSADNLNAFSKRIEIFPFNNPTPKEKQDPELLEKLLSERDYIVSWAVIGWQRWYSNNFKFTTCQEVITLSENYSRQSNSIDAFIKDSCIFDSSFRIHGHVLEKAYLNYCDENNLSAVSTKSFNQYLKSIPNLNYSRFRLANENKYGYTGIKLLK